MNVYPKEPLLGLLNVVCTVPSKPELRVDTLNRGLTKPTAVVVHVILDGMLTWLLGEEASYCRRVEEVSTATYLPSSKEGSRVINFSKLYVSGLP